MIGPADLRAALAAHGRAVVALVTVARGSTPRGAGTAMLVTDHGVTGTLGGGAVEHRALGLARDMLAGQGPERTEVDFPLGPTLDQCCGGHMRVALALVAQAPGDGAVALWPDGPLLDDPPPGRPVYLYGAGHVGQAVMAALAPLPLRLVWIDAQQGRMQPPEGVEIHETPLPEALAATAPADAMHLVMTHSHALDLEIVATVLARPFAFCGLIGSATKRARFTRRLAERGLQGHAIARLTCPIGLTGLRDKRPEVIAASVAAQVLLEDAALATQRAESA